MEVVEWCLYSCFDGVPMRSACKGRRPGAPRHAVLRCAARTPATQADRVAALERMAAQGGCVMVCTDAAARGLDLPDVSHVVQADFALSAIDFLHRVRRHADGERALWLRLKDAGRDRCKQPAPCSYPCLGGSHIF